MHVVVAPAVGMHNRGCSQFARCQPDHPASTAHQEVTEACMGTRCAAVGSEPVEIAQNSGKPGFKFEVRRQLRGRRLAQLQEEDACSCPCERMLEHTIHHLWRCCPSIRPPPCPSSLSLEQAPWRFCSAGVRRTRGVRVITGGAFVQYRVVHSRRGESERRLLAPRCPP